MQGRGIVKADDNLPDSLCCDKASDGGVTASTERLMLGFAEELIDERLQYGMELAICNLGD